MGRIRILSNLVANQIARPSPSQGAFAVSQTSQNLNAA
jgi:hypothetical protein